MNPHKIYSLLGWGLSVGSLVGFLAFTAYQYGTVLHSLALVTLLLFLVCGIVFSLGIRDWTDYLAISVITTLTVILQWR